MDYKNGQIYMLEPTCEYEEGDVYYGSTTTTLVKRLYQHRMVQNNCRSKILFEKYGRDNVKIVLLCEYPCKNKAELRAKEGEYQRENKCVNKIIAGRTQKEWKELNKQAIKEKRKIYNSQEKNKTHLAEYAKTYHENNKEKQLIAQRKYRAKKRLLKLQTTD